MKKITLISSAVAAFAATSTFATTATSLSSFGGMEEPSAIVHSGGSVTQGDTYINITHQGSGVFRFLLRYHKGDWCDGDRDTTSTSMQRAEVKVLGPRQLRGETYVYSSQWRTSSGYQFSTTNTCAINQVKGYGGGDISQALSTTFLTSQTGGRTAHGAGSGMTTVRTFNWTAGSYMTIANRIKISSSAGSTDGSYETSINGNAYSGVTNVVMERPGATQYQPKWGLYRSQGNLNITRGTDEYVEHRDVQANKITGGGGQTYNWESESLSYTHSGTGASVQTDANSSNGTWISLDAENTGSWLQFVTPSVAAGTYSVRMMWKGHPSRGILSLNVDGTQVGGTLDQYSASASYPTTTFGNVTFSSSGTHTIRLTVTGKNSASSNYILSADKFTLVPQ